MNKTDKIYVAGHRGMVGNAMIRTLRTNGFELLVTRTHEELDLLDQQAVIEFFKAEKPDVVFLAAAKVGGMQANDTFSADFLYENLMIQNNVIHNAYMQGAKKIASGFLLHLSKIGSATDPGKALVIRTS